MTRPTKDMTGMTNTREQLLALLQGDDAMRALLQTTVEEVVEAEMDEALGAGVIRSRAVLVALAPIGWGAVRCSPSR